MDQVKVRHRSETRNLLQGKHMDDEQGEETGYVTDSSFTDRQGSQKRSVEKDERSYISRRKTKSERDRNRPRPPRNDSESEVSDHTQNQPKYRRRTGSKQYDKENFDQRRYSRRGSAHLICGAAQEFIIEDENSRVEKRTRPRQRRDSRVNSFVALRYEAGEKINGVTMTEAGLAVRPNYLPLIKSHHIVTPKHSPLTSHDNARKPKPSSTSDDSRDELACLKSAHSDHIRHTQLTAIDASEDLDTLKELRSAHDKDAINTARMDLKDIYTGTWNPKEKEVFNIVLQNMGTKDSKKKNKSNKSTPVREAVSPLKYPLTEYVKSQSSYRKQNRASLSGIFPSFKWFKNVLKRSDRKAMEPEFIFPKEPIFDFMVPKKKGLFRLFRRKKATDDYTRRRAQSTNSHYSVDFLLNAERRPYTEGRRRGSSVTLTSPNDKIKRTKSEDNLDGAFEYFANQTQVFQRTPNTSKKLKSRTNSVEGLETPDGVTAQSLPKHIFEAVRSSHEQNTSKEHFIYPDANVAPGKKAIRHDLSVRNPRHHKQYDSAYEDDNVFYDADMPTDPRFTSLAYSVPNYSYISADACPQTPYSSHKPYMAPCRSVYSPRCTRNNNFETFSSNASAVSNYSSYSAESGIANSHAASYSVNSERHENGNQNYNNNSNLRDEDDPLLNSFHQRRAKPGFHFWV